MGKKFIKFIMILNDFNIKKIFWNIYQIYFKVRCYMIYVILEEEELVVLFSE